MHRNANQILQQGAEAIRFYVLARKALHGANGRERLIGHAHRFADPILHLRAGLAQRAPEGQRGRNNHRDHGQGGERQAGIGHEHHGDAANEEQRLPRELGNPRTEQRLQEREVTAEPAGQLTGSALRKKGGRESDQVRKGLLSQRRHDALGGGTEQKHLHEIRHGLHREHAEEAKGNAIERVAIPLLKGRIEQIA